MTVEVGKPTKGDISAELTVVGNLIGAQHGRRRAAHGRAPRVGERQARRPRVAAASGWPRSRTRRSASRSSRPRRRFEVAAGHHPPARSRPEVRRRPTSSARRTCSSASCCRSRRSTTPKRARRPPSAQLDLARAQFSQAQARLDELRINLEQHHHHLAGRTASSASARRPRRLGVAARRRSSSVVDISSVRLVANVVEKDLRRVNAGDPARVEVDAFPGETFAGRIARVAPVLDPATRTAQIEIEVPNADFRLKPGMYARVSVTIESRKDTTLVPKSVGRRLRRQARRLHDDRRQQGASSSRSRSASRTPTGSKCAAASPTATRSSRPAPRRCATATARAWPASGGPGGAAAAAGAAAARPAPAGGGQPVRGRAGGRRRRAAGGRQAAARPGAAPATRAGAVVRTFVRRWRTDEYSATRHRTTRHDVHDQLRRHAARRHLADPAAGRPDARRQLPDDHRPRRTTPASARSRWRSSSPARSSRR